jgi:predicted ribosomally synthesized peptide with SipW-like signal peptide
MKKILLSLFVVGVVAVATFGVTRAYFTDQEQILGNTIETARINVNLSGPTVDETRVWTGSHLFGGMLPGETTDPYQLRVYNRGHGQSTVPVKYAWSVEHTGGSADLFNIVEVRVTDGNCDWPTSNPGGIQVRYNGPLADMGPYLRTFPSNLGVNITRCTWFEYTLPVTAGNAYQGLDTEFRLILDATQVDNPGWSE